MKLILIITCCFSFLSFSKAFANSMINNQAVAFVQGNIIQEVSDGSESTINIGSIQGKSIKNSRVKAYVKGDIIVKVSKNKTTTLNIGSIIGEKK